MMSMSRVGLLACAVIALAGCRERDEERRTIERLRAMEARRYASEAAKPKRLPKVDTSDIAGRLERALREADRHFPGSHLTEYSVTCVEWDGQLARPCPYIALTGSIVCGDSGPVVHGPWLTAQFRKRRPDGKADVNCVTVLDDGRLLRAKLESWDQWLGVPDRPRCSFREVIDGAEKKGFPRGPFHLRWSPGFDGERGRFELSLEGQKLGEHAIIANCDGGVFPPSERLWPE